MSDPHDDAPRRSRWVSSARTPRRLFAVSVAVAALLGSCADEPPSRTGSGDAATGTAVTGPPIVATCGGVTFQGLPPDPSAFTIFDDWASVDLSEIGMERGFFDDFEWYVADETSSALELFGRSRPDGREEHFASAGFVSEDGMWSPTGFGDCRVELSADGWGNARFELDPSVPLDPTSSTISILATETECASGQPPDGREVRAVVLDEDAESVSVVILVEPIHTDANCQGNPAFPFEVDIGSPLGDRHLLDASVDPPIDVTASGSTGSVPNPS